MAQNTSHQTKTHFETYKNQLKIGSGAPLLPILKLISTAAGLQKSNYSSLLTMSLTDKCQIACGDKCILCIKSNGELVALSERNRFDIEGNFTQISCDGSCGAALRDDNVIVMIDNGSITYVDAKIPIKQIAVCQWNYSKTACLTEDGKIALVTSDKTLYFIAEFDEFDIIKVLYRSNSIYGLTRDGRILLQYVDGRPRASFHKDFKDMCCTDDAVIGLRNNGGFVYMADFTRYKVSGLNNFVQVASGNSHYVGLKNDGTVETFGYFSKGQRVGAPGPNERFVRVECGGNHSIGIRSDGSFKIWGGEYLDGEDTLSGKFVKMACSNRVGMGLHEDGSVVTWGNIRINKKNIPANLVCDSVGQLKIKI